MGHMKRVAAQDLGPQVQPTSEPAAEGASLAWLPRELLETRPVAIIGAGPAGVAVAQGLAATGEGPPVVLIGEEPDAPYNRVKLTPFLAGDTGEAELRIGGELDKADPRRFARLAGCRIMRIDPERMVIRDEAGNELHCSHIVLATGSRPLLPPIPGVNLACVHTFRTLADARILATLADRTTHAVVVGGGLLGLEAARGLVRHECPVSVVERADRLMPTQLDGEASHRLQGMLEAHGVDVHLGTNVKRIDGSDSEASVILEPDDAIDCNLVIMAVGVRPNAELASTAGLDTHRGIIVDRHMRTSAPGILAVGECAELNGCVQGLAGPALAQSRVAVDTIRKRDRPHEPAVAATRLKIFDQPVFSIGSPESLGRTVEWSDGNDYRRLTLWRGRVIAAAGIGEWPELHDIQRAVSDHRFLWPWQVARFRATGRWKHGAEAAGPDSWAADRIVCNCTQTTCGQLRMARAGGCQTVQALQERTGASGVCGSCHEMVALFADTPAANTPGIDARRRWQLLAGLATGLVLGLAMLPRLPAPASLDTFWFDMSALWRHGGWRQVTGYGLLVCLVLLTGLSARRRLKRFRISTAPIWRWCHAITGVSLLALVGLHTALAWGGGLTSWLMSHLAGASLAGAAAAVIGPDTSPRIRQTVFWSHLLLVWPLPALLGFHVLSVYWF